MEDAKKKEMTGRGRAYLDKLLKHEDDPLYSVKATVELIITTKEMGR